MNFLVYAALALGLGAIACGEVNANPTKHDPMTGPDAKAPDTGAGSSTPSVGEHCEEPVIGAPPSSLTPIVRCDSAVANGSEPLIDDFEDMDLQSYAVDGREGLWWRNTDPPTAELGLNFVNDTQRPGRTLSYAGGPFSGFSAFGVTFRLTESGCEFCSYDASIYDGIRFSARGNVEVWVGLELPSVRSVAEGGTCPNEAQGCWDQHGKSIQLTLDWQTYEVSFTDAQQRGWGYDVAFDPTALYALVFLMPVGSKYDVRLDDVEFYRN